MHSLAHQTDADRRRHLRVPVDLDCEVTFTDRTVHARVRDISLGGARLEMPLTAAHYDFDDLTTLHIEDIGLVRVAWRWSADRLVGVEFLSPEVIRQSLTRLIAAQDPRGMIRPTGG